MKNKLKFNTKLKWFWKWLNSDNFYIYSFKAYLDRMKNYTLKTQLGENYWNMTQKEFLNTIV